MSMFGVMAVKMFKDSIIRRRRFPTNYCRRFFFFNIYFQFTIVCIPYFSTADEEVCHSLPNLLNMTQKLLFSKADGDGHFPCLSLFCEKCYPGVNVSICDHDVAYTIVLFEPVLLLNNYLVYV